MRSSTTHTPLCTWCFCGTMSLCPSTERLCPPRPLELPPTSNPPPCLFAPLDSTTTASAGLRSWTPSLLVRPVQMSLTPSTGLRDTQAAIYTIGTRPAPTTTRVVSTSAVQWRQALAGSHGGGAKDGMVVQTQLRLQQIDR